jgi:uncharacterized protein
MKFLIFFTIFSLITGAISYYIFIRGLQATPAGSPFRNAYIIVFWIVAASFIAGRMLERWSSSFLTDILAWIGSFWIAAMLYLLFAVVLLDIARLVNHFFPWYPAYVVDHYELVKYVLRTAIAGIVGIALLAGHINSVLPRTTDLNLKVTGKKSKLKHLTIVAASDIHLGIIVGRSRFNDIVSRINRLDPDIVLLPGDIVDEDLAPVIRQNLGESLKSIHSRYGVYAVTGNHEYFGGVTEACAYLEGHGIAMLRDQSVKLEDSFYLVGREDLSSARITGLPPRKSLAALMEEIDTSYPVILMDHQPYRLQEAAENGIDLQISGHTHYGQLWPINYIVKGIYELPWGYKKIRDTHFYVSNGVGTWGPPVRIGNRPEIVRIRLNFE